MVNAGGRAQGAALLRPLLGDALRRRADIERYQRYFPVPEGAVAGEWTPGYLIDFWTPELIARAAPEARILVLLRDPIDRFRSGLTHQLATSREPLRPPRHPGRLPAQHLRAPAAAGAGSLPARAGLGRPVRGLPRRSGRGAGADLRVPGSGPARAGRGCLPRRGQPHDAREVRALGCAAGIAAGGLHQRHGPAGASCCRSSTSRCGPVPRRPGWSSGP